MVRNKPLILIALALCGLLVGGCVAGNKWPIGTDKQRDEQIATPASKLPHRQGDIGLPAEDQGAPAEVMVDQGQGDLISKMEADSTYQTESRTFIPEFRRAISREKEKELQKQKDMMQESASVGTPIKVDEKFVEKRLVVYQARKKQWNELAGRVVSLDMGGAWPAGWHECVQNVEMVFFGYNRLLEGKRSAQSSGARINIWRLLSIDLGYAESGCEKVLSESNTNVTQTLKDYSQMAKTRTIDLVKQYFEKGLYLEATRAYENQLDTASDSLEMKIMYSVALQRTNRLRAAAEVVKEIVAADDGSLFKEYFKTQRIKIEFADLLMLLGQIEQAKKVYTEVDQEIAVLENKADWVGNQIQILEENRIGFPVYQDFLRAYYSYDGKQIPKVLSRGYEKIDQAGDSLMQVSAGLLLQDIENRAEDWLNQQLMLVDELIHDHEYDQAMVIVNQLLESAPESRQYSLLQIKEDIEIEAGKEQQVRQQLQTQQTTSQWQEAIKLFDLKEYGASIALFTSLLNTDYDAKARRKLTEASNLAASEIRRKAAGLFIKARKIKDLEKKKQVLMKSKTLLVELIEKYPTAGIIEKANQNLQVIEEQISVLEFRQQNEELAND